MAFASLKETIKSWFVSEPLGIEHGGTGSNSVDVVSKIEELESAWDSVSHVVESGTSGIWTYRKWDNGIAECWGCITFSSGSIKTWGYDYYTENSSGFTSYPFTFISRPVEQVSIKQPGIDFWIVVESNNSKSSTGSYYGVRSTSAGSSDYTVSIDIYVIGQWS